MFPNFNLRVWKRRNRTWLESNGRRMWWNPSLEQGAPSHSCDHAGNLLEKSLGEGSAGLCYGFLCSSFQLFVFQGFHKHLSVTDWEEMFGGSSWESCVEGEHRMTLQPVPHDLCIHCTHPQHSGAALLLLMENLIIFVSWRTQKTRRVHKCLWNKLECKLPLAQGCCWSGNDKQSRPCLKILARFLMSSPMSANPFAACKVR